MGELVEVLERHDEIGLSAEIRSQRLGLSAATVERLLKPFRDRGGCRPYSQSQSSSSLKAQIPVRTLATGGTWPPVQQVGGAALRIGNMQLRFERPRLGRKWKEAPEAVLESMAALRDGGHSLESGQKQDDESPHDGTRGVRDIGLQADSARGEREPGDDDLDRHVSGGAWCQRKAVVGALSPPRPWL